MYEAKETTMSEALEQAKQDLAQAEEHLAHHSALSIEMATAHAVTGILRLWIAGTEEDEQSRVEFEQRFEPYTRGGPVSNKPPVAQQGPTGLPPEGAQP
jgi:hypothetical protein